MVNSYHKLIKVEPDANNNKIYLIEKQSDGSYKCSWGRVGAGLQTKIYSSYQIQRKYDEKIAKGYVDITYQGDTKTVSNKKTNIKEVDELFDILINNTSSFINNNYEVKDFTPLQIKEGQSRLDLLVKVSKKKSVSKEELHNLIKPMLITIPRKIGNVKEYMDYSIKNLSKFIIDEQDRLDSCSSSQLTKQTDTVDLIKELNISIKPCDGKSLKEVERIFNIGNSYNAKIYSAFEVINNTTNKNLEDYIKTRKNINTELLIHGTRIPNVISILKSGLLIRPSNAFHSGSAYGDGVYHSLHTQKSLGYTGNTREKILFIQNVHTGNQYVYNGYYRDGKDISRSEMNYNDLNKRGYDSLYVKPGDGLMNSEYIVYNHNQTSIKYLILIK